MIGLILGNLLGGIAVIETVFTIPGLGRLMVDSIFARDYPVIQGCLLFVSCPTCWSISSSTFFIPSSIRVWLPNEKVHTQRAYRRRSHRPPAHHCHYRPVLDAL